MLQNNALHSCDDSRLRKTVCETLKRLWPSIDAIDSLMFWNEMDERRRKELSDSSSGFRKKKQEWTLIFWGFLAENTGHTRKKWVDLLGDGEQQKQEVGMQAPQEGPCHGRGSLMCSSAACWELHLVVRRLHWLNVDRHGPHTKQPFTPLFFCWLMVSLEF